jgi:hypothetical protein
LLLASVPLWSCVVAWLSESCIAPAGDRPCEQSVDPFVDLPIANPYHSSWTTHLIARDLQAFQLQAPTQ